MNRLTKVGVTVAVWFLLNRLLVVIAGNWPGNIGALLDAIIFGIGVYMVVARRARWWMAIMTFNWFSAIIFNFDNLTTVAVAWNAIYAVCWTCGIIGMWQRTEA